MNSFDDVFRSIWLVWFDPNKISQSYNKICILLRYNILAYKMKQHIYYSNKVTSPSNTYIHLRCDIVIVLIFTPNLPENKIYELLHLKHMEV